MSKLNSLLASCLIAMSTMSMASNAVRAQETSWVVEKSVGDVRLVRPGADTVSFDSNVSVKPGDEIRTGRNGRVLLVRGAERIMVSPNSALALPAGGDAGFTTVQQQSGVIVFEVEKKNVQHFEVETPYIAAVVKGTIFRVTVDGRGSSVDVERGQVQVADLKTGRNALVDPGQRASVNTASAAGLVLKGAGALHPIENGAPRLQRVPVRSAAMAPGIKIAATAAQFTGNELGKEFVKPAAADAFAKAQPGESVKMPKVSPSAVHGGAKNTVQGAARRGSATGEAGGNVVRGYDFNLSAEGGIDAAANSGGLMNLGGNDNAASVNANSGSAANAAAGAVNGAAGAANGSVSSAVNGTVNGLTTTVGGTLNTVNAATGNGIGGTVSGLAGTVNGVGGAAANGLGGIVSGLAPGKNK